MIRAFASFVLLGLSFTWAAFGVAQEEPKQNPQRPEDRIQKDIVIRKLPVTKDFGRALLNQNGQAGILASIFFQAFQGCFGNPHSKPDGPPLLSDFRRDVVPSKDLVESAYRLARTDSTPLQDVSDRVVTMSVPELSGLLVENPCIIAAAFSRTELSTGSRAQLVKIPADQWTNKGSTSKNVPKYVEFVESVQSVMDKLTDYLNGKSDQISTFPLLGTFFGEEHVPFTVTSKKTSKTSCLLTLRLDMHKVPFLKTLVIGAQLATATADLDDRKPDGVTEKSPPYGELGRHYPVTVAHGDRECTNNCAFSWELSEDAIRIPGAREFQVEVRDIGPPLNASSPGSFKVTPFYEWAFSLQSLHVPESSIEGCN